MTTRPIVDWTRIDGKRCDECGHFSIVKIRLRGPIEIERCNKHDRACSVVRHIDGKCGPRAKDWTKS